jgi:hypothetical protein
MTSRNVTLALLLTLCACGAPTTQTPFTAVKPASEQASGTTLDAQFNAALDKGAMAGLCMHTAQESVDRVRKDLDYIDTVLPNVPPEESEYLQRENDAVDKLYRAEEAAKASNGPSSARWSALTKRPLFNVWKARKDLAKAITSVDGIYDPQKARKEWEDAKTTVSPARVSFRREQPDTLLRMLDAANYVESAVVSLHEMPAPSGFAADQYLTFIFRVSSVSGSLRWAMKCQLAHVVFDQPVRNDVAQ